MMLKNTNYLEERLSVLTTIFTVIRAKYDIGEMVRIFNSG